MKVTKTILAGIAVVLTMVAVPAGAQCIVDSDGLDNGVYSVPLLAGQTIPAGTVDVRIDDARENLIVEYNTTGGWELVETHLWVGANLADMPQTRKGSPIPGQFPYKSGDITGATSWSFAIPLVALNFQCPQVNMEYWVAAHCALRKLVGTEEYQTETGWGEGKPLVDKGNWAMAFQITLSCECDDPEGEVEYGSETAFAYSATDGTCFLDIDDNNDGDPDFKRWGWTIGPLAAGTYTFPIYAGAGQCDISKGTLVGNLSVNYDGNKAVVSFNMTETDAVTGLAYTMNVAHLYVGAEILPRDVNEDYTVAPGQYPKNSGEIYGAIDQSFEVTGLSGSVHVVAHAEVYGFAK